MSAAPQVFWPRLLNATPLGPRLKLLRFSSWPKFEFSAGQFLMLSFPDAGETWRAYSLCSSPADAASFFEIAVAEGGGFSKRLFALTPQAQDQIRARGPYGGWTWRGEGHAILVGAGSAIAPFRSMTLLGKGRITLFISADSSQDFYFSQEYGSWKATRVHQRQGAWRPAEIAAADSDRTATYFLCGGAAAVQELAAGLRGQGVRAEKIRSESWG
ncbi:MAG: FAD-dependent oxidoreductase [Elusimicrobiota bacterium]